MQLESVARAHRRPPPVARGPSPALAGGLFVNYNELPFAEFFRRPSTDLTGYYMPCVRVRDHCNGVLLLYNALLNPAAQGWIGIISTKKSTSSLILPSRRTVKCS